MSKKILSFHGFPAYRQAGAKKGKKTRGETAFLFTKMRKTIIKINIIKLSLFISAGVLFSLYFPVNAQAKEINLQNVVTLVNQSREENNLKPLLINPELSKIARDKAQDMVRNHYFAHTSPAGITPWHWFIENNYSYKYAGENLAVNYDSAEEEHEAWMKSPTHKKNILNPNFTEIGIATANGIIEGKKSQITVQVFATPQIKIIAKNNFNNNFSDKKSTFILGAQSENLQAPKALNTQKESLSYEIIDANNKFIRVAKSQSDKIIWTIALLVLLIISRDTVLSNLYPKTLHHKYSMANLILFIMLYYILF